MKKIINLLLALVLTANLAACWTEDIPEAGAARHQVTGLTATPGDEEVLLSWSMPEGWNPTDFIVYYTNTDSKTVIRRTGGLMNCTVTGACQRHAIHILRAGRLRRKHLELRGHYGQTVDLAVPRHRPGDRSRRCLRHAHVVEAFNDGALLYALLLQRGRHRRRDGTAPRQGYDRHHAGQPGQRQELLLLVSGQLCQGNL